MNTSAVRSGERRSWRGLAVALVVVAVVLSALALVSTTPADAQTTSCPQGTQVGLRCEISGNPAVMGIGCGINATIDLVDVGCYVLITALSPQAPCDGPYLADSTSGVCTVDNPSADPSFTCPSPGFGLEVVVVVDAANPNLIVSCLQAPSNDNCPAMTTPDPVESWSCRKPISPSFTSVCDAGFRAFGSECLRFELLDDLNLSCPTGVLVDITCKIDLGWARQTEASCPVGGAVILNGGDCYLLEPIPSSGTCPAPTTLDPSDSTQCRRPVDLVPGARFCNEGEIYEFERCVQFMQPIGIPLRDCLGVDAGDAICLNTVQFTQADGQMLAGNPTVVNYFSCPGGSGQWQMRSQNSSDLASSTSGSLIEITPGVYEATINVGIPGNVEFVINLSCNGEPIRPVINYPFFTSGATCDGRSPTLFVTPGQPLIGTSGDDVILGTSGADVIDAGNGDDTICAFGGDDIIIAGPGNDVVAAGDGDDVIRGNSGDDLLVGFAGNDRIFGGTGDDELNGGAGDDYLGGFGGADQIVGGEGDDTIFGGYGADNIHGGQDDDTIRGLVGNDIIRGGDGNDILNGDRGNDFIEGGAGNDTIGGGNADDRLFGESGNDDVKGGRADDELSGGDGVDRCTGNQHVLGDIADASCETVFGIP